MSDSFVTPWTVAHQAPLSIGFSRQGYWSGLPFSSPGDLPDPGIESISPALAGGFVTAKPPAKPQRPPGLEINRGILRMQPFSVLWVPTGEGTLQGGGGYLAVMPKTSQPEV